MSRILVTGGSGFVGSHCLLQLLAAGHEVRTTVRNLKRRDDVLAMLKQGGAADPGAMLTFFAADLEKDAGWAEAVEGCDYVLHVASPFPAAARARQRLLLSGESATYCPPARARPVARRRARATRCPPVRRAL